MRPAVLPPRRSLVRFAWWSLTAFAALASLLLIVVTLALPGWAAGRGVALASEALGRSVRIEQAQFQPWRLALVVDGLSIAGPAPGAPPLLTLARLDAALSLRSLLRGSTVIESLTLTAPVLRVARLAEGRYDIDDLIERFTARSDAAGREVAVYNIELNDGRVFFDDRPVQRRHELKALRLALPFVSTLEADVAVKVRPELAGQLDGVPFDSRAEALPFADAASGRLSLRLAGLDLAPLAAYLPARLPLRLAAGRLDADLALDFAERPRQAPGLRLSGELRLHELSLTQADGRPLFAAQRVVLPIAELQPLQRQLALGQVQLEAPGAWLWPQGRRAAAAVDAKSPPWQWRLAGLTVSDGRFTAREVVLDDIAMQLGAAVWPLTREVTAQASLRLDAGRASGQARLSPAALRLDAELGTVALERLAPWLPLPSGVRAAGTLSGRVGLHVDNPLADGAADRARLSLTELRLDEARLRVAGAAQPLLAWAGAQLDRADVDLGRRQARLGPLRLRAPQARLERAADGRFNLAPLLPAPGEAVGPAWTLQLAGLAVEGGTLRWLDAAAGPGLTPAAAVAAALDLQLGPLSWPARAPVPLRLAAQVAPLDADDRPVAAAAGQLQWQGAVGLAPLSARGRLQARSLPLQLLDAYLDPAWSLHLRRADLAGQAEVDANRADDGRWRTRVDGDLRIGPLALLQTRAVDGRRVLGEDLLSWQSLQLDGLGLLWAAGAPPQLSVRDAVLDDAYARLIVDERGRFNLRDLGPAEAAAAPAASAPAFNVGQLRLNRGLLDFNDRFVRPGYSARLSDLHGTLGAFASAGAAMAPLTLRGQIGAGGTLEVDGQLKPGRPLAMDVQARAAGIELAPLSGYAGRYAGYAIAGGRLSAQLRYRVEPGGRLVASNRLVLNQLNFGERVDSTEATALPVRLAVALLKDRDGVIDVELPVSGSLNDPQFSLGGLLGRLLLNLVGKAVTAPFALFTGNESADADRLAFAPGRSELADTSRLDRIAAQLAAKPGVQLTLTGWADAETELPALREQRLDAALQATGAATPAQALQRLYDAARLPHKPRNALGLPRELPPAQMRGLLMAADDIGDEALRQLAASRAIAVRDALLARGAPAERLQLAPPRLCDGACGSVARPHVELSLAAY